MAWIPAPPDDLNNHGAVREWMVAVQDVLQRPSTSGLPSGGVDGDIVMKNATVAFWATPGGVSDADSRGFHVERDGTTARVQQLVPVRLAMGSAEPDDADVNQQSICFWVVDAHDNGATPYTLGVKYHTADDTFVTATLGTLT